MVTYLDIILGQRFELSCGRRIQEFLEEANSKVVILGSPMNEAFQICFGYAADGIDAEAHFRQRNCRLNRIGGRLTLLMSNRISFEAAVSIVWL